MRFSLPKWEKIRFSKNFPKILQIWLQGFRKVERASWTISPRNMKRFDLTDQYKMFFEVFARSAARPQKLVFFSVFKAFVTKALKTLKKTNFWGRAVKTSCVKIFSISPWIYYESQTTFYRSGLSAAPFLDRFGHMYVKILNILQKSAQNPSLKTKIPNVFAQKQRDIDSFWQ